MDLNTMTIDDKVKDVPKCQHDTVYILKVELEIPEYQGQFWYTCLNPDCQTTGIDPLKDHMPTPATYEKKPIYVKK